MLDNGHKTVGNDCSTDLNPDGILRNTPELFDLQMLLHPFMEKLYLPSVLIEIGNFKGSEMEGIRKKNKVSVLLFIIEPESRVFFQLMFFLNLKAFGRCTGITFVDSTMIPVCHNLRRYSNKVFKGFAKDGKGTMGWCHGFKLHLACNDRGEIISFVLTGANVDDRDPKVWTSLAKKLYGKLFADRGYISKKLFDSLFEDGIHLVTGLRANMKNKLMPFYDKMMLRKRLIIETINDMLKNTAQIVHSRHRSVNNFIMNLIAALGAYCFFPNKPKALNGYTIEKTNQLCLF